MCKISFSAVEVSNFTMSPAQWDEVNVFVEQVGWEFVFGLNALLRSPSPNGVWNSSNAAQLMSFTVSREYRVQWELGNGIEGEGEGGGGGGGEGGTEKSGIRNQYAQLIRTLHH